MQCVWLNVMLSAVILAHTVLGCCWHHGHPGDDRHEAAGNATALHGCSGHGHVHAGVNDDHEPHVAGNSEKPDSRHEHRHLCSEPDCIYVTGKHVRVENASPMLWVPVAVDAPFSDVFRSVMLSGAADAGREPVRPAGLRAALQVWLI